MTYCTSCGKQNPPANKFCIGCGKPLHTTAVPPVQQKQPEQPASISPSAGYERPAAATAASNKINWIILGIVLALGLAAGVYFIFFNKKGSSKKEEVSVPAQDSTALPAPATPAEPVASDAVPLNPDQGQVQKMEITPAETDQVTQTIQQFYDAEDKEDITALLSHYRFPLDQYYQFSNLDYDQMHKKVVDAFNGKLYYHKIDIKWDYSSVQKLPSGDYKVLLYADYTSASQSGDDRKTKSIHLTIILDNSYQITSIYPN